MAIRMYRTSGSNIACWTCNKTITVRCYNDARSVIAKIDGEGAYQRLMLRLLRDADEPDAVLAVVASSQEYDTWRGEEPS